MSKFKKILKVLTLGLAFSTTPNTTQINNQVQVSDPSTYQEITIPESELSINQIKSEIQTPTSQTPKPKKSPLNIENNDFEEFLSYFKFINQTRNIKPLKVKQIEKLRSIIDTILNKPDKFKTQSEKDLLMFYNRFRYQIDKPLIIESIQSILGVELSSVTIKGNLRILHNRIRNNAYNTNREEYSLQPLEFYPNEVDSDLNSFLITNLSKPHEISNGSITSIHPSYYRFLVGLLLIENNFGNTTTSNANAQGKFQIKPEAQKFTREGFNLNRTQSQNLEVLGFLHLFQIAKMFDINISKKPTPEEIILLSWIYFQGINSYRQLYVPSNNTLDKIRNYSYNILLIMQREDLFIINQNKRNSTRS